MSDFFAVYFAGLWLFTLFLWAASSLRNGEPKAHIGETPETDPRGA